MRTQTRAPSRRTPEVAIVLLPDELSSGLVLIDDATYSFKVDLYGVTLEKFDLTTHRVYVGPGGLAADCDCNDRKYRRTVCKHMAAAEVIFKATF